MFTTFSTLFEMIDSTSLNVLKGKKKVNNVLFKLELNGQLWYECWIVNSKIKDNYKKNLLCLSKILSSSFQFHNK